MSNATHLGKGSWIIAARLIMRWLEQHERVDALLASMPAGLSPIERARCQHWVYGVIRHYGRITASLDKLIAFLSSHCKIHKTYIMKLILYGDSFNNGTGSRDANGNGSFSLNFSAFGRIPIRCLITKVFNIEN